MRKVILICVVAAAVFVGGCGGESVGDQFERYAVETCADNGGIQQIAVWHSAALGFTVTHYAIAVCKDGTTGNPATKEQTND